MCAGTDGSDAELPAECAAAPGKENVGQLARAYLLKMETVGYLEPAEQAHLTAELETAGLTEIDYEGSTLEPAGYGERIILQIHGKLGGHYEIREKRVSTAKN